jgi:hypothetical protein
VGTEVSDGNLCMELEICTQAEPGRISVATGCTATWCAAAVRSRIDARSVLPGVEPTTYRTEGYSSEHENLDPSAEQAKPGKPTGLATSRARGGASVVVGARESRVHGEGKQR